MKTIIKRKKIKLKNTSICEVCKYCVNTVKMFFFLCLECKCRKKKRNRKTQKQIFSYKFFHMNDTPSILHSAL